jgi:hypothetical protein
MNLFPLPRDWRLPSGIKFRCDNPIGLQMFYNDAGETGSQISLIDIACYRSRSVPCNKWIIAVVNIHVHVKAAFGLGPVILISCCREIYRISSKTKMSIFFYFCPMGFSNSMLV